jgi:hypothetical protein
MSNDFQWSDVEDGLVQEDQLAVAVYLNPKGDVVIRQKADGYAQQEDPWIVISKDKLERLIEKLQQYVAD